jgi:hypothetical protein
VRKAAAVVLVVGVLLACTPLYAGEEPELPAQPRLAVSSLDRVWDLIDERPNGVRIGEVCEHEFEVTNEGTAPLTLTEAKAFDPFVTVALPAGEIPPGGTGAIKVTLNTPGLDPGQIASHVVVKSNDPDSARKPLVLTLKARLVPEPETLLVVSPQVYDVGVLRVGDSKDIAYKCQNAGSTPFTVRAISVIDRTRFRIVENIDSGLMAPGGEKDFRLAFTPQLEDAGQKVDFTFRVSTDSAEFPGVLCRVQGYVEKAEGVEIEPIYLDSGRQPSYSFRVLNYTERTVQVTGTRGEIEFGPVVVEPQGKKELHVSVSSEADLKEISFKVVPDYVAPQPETPETGEVTDGETPEEGTNGGEAVEDETPAETEPTDVETPETPTETETTVEGG